MKLTTARHEHVCSACSTKISIGDDYYSSSYNAFCTDCGEKKTKGILVYNIKERRYIDISHGTQKCDYCNKQSKGILYQKPVCEDHIGKVMQENQGDQFGKTG